MLSSRQNRTDQITRISVNNPHIPQYTPGVDPACIGSVLLFLLLLSEDISCDGQNDDGDNNRDSNSECRDRRLTCDSSCLSVNYEVIKLAVKGEVGDPDRCEQVLECDLVVRSRKTNVSYTVSIVVRLNSVADVTLEYILDLSLSLYPTVIETKEYLSAAKPAMN